MKMEEVKEIGGQILEVLLLYLGEARVKVNDLCAGLEAWQVIALSVGVTLITVWFINFLFHPLYSLKDRIKATVFRIVRSLPPVKKYIKKQLDETIVSMSKHAFALEAGDHYIKSLPAKGSTEDEVIARINKKYKTLDKVDWAGGKVSGTVYSGTDDLSRLCARVYEDFAWSNPLHVDVFPSVRRMEAEVIAMCLKMFNGGQRSCGVMTSGGTESILMAVLAARQIAYARGVEYPEIIAGDSVHAAFDKAAFYYRMKLIHVPVDPITRKVNVKAMRKKINKNTCMLVGSAPCFNAGVIDPIEDIAKLGVKYNIPVHVDCCLGGFIVPFLKKAGFDVPPFDFMVKGVTSISADTHKYGFAPKGSSVILYSDRKYRENQFFVAPDWTGGIYATSTIAGSRAGAIIAACWATLMYIGEEGYVKSTKQIVDTAKYIEDGCRKIPGIYVMGKPDTSVVAIASNDIDIFRLYGDLTKCGWSLNSLQFPSSFHLCVTIRQCADGVADEFLQDVRTCAAEIMKNPSEKASGSAALYGASQGIPDRSLVTDISKAYLDVWFSTDVYDENDKVKVEANGTH
ncbi:sphingosine-1-phosphate lyase 1-like [Amphiura filiformis]|uniref:sphingosine-1-phosphate lyase 1-like n=1 Tax=Amphiura filiformis TaxID=82378 RepID=UPI003B216AAA